VSTSSEYSSNSIDTYSNGVNGLPSKPAMLPEYPIDMPSSNKPMALPAPLPASRLSTAAATMPANDYTEAPLLLALSKAASTHSNNYHTSGVRKYCSQNNYHSPQHYDRAEFEREMRESEMIALEVLCGGKRLKTTTL